MFYNIFLFKGIFFSATSLVVYGWHQLFSANFDQRRRSFDIKKLFEELTFYSRYYLLLLVCKLFALEDYVRRNNMQIFVELSGIL